MTQSIITKIAISAIGVALAVWVALAVAQGFNEAAMHTAAMLQR